MREVRTQNIGKTLGLGCMALVIFTATSCKKKTPPPPPSPLHTQQGGAAAPIDTSTKDGAFSGASAGTAWRAQRSANEKNISVGQGKSFAHITYKPEVKFIDRAAFNASLEGIATDGHGALFKNASPEIRALKAGDVLIVKNAFACKIVYAQTVNGETALVVDRAMLTDVVQSGEINIDSPISFHGPKLAAAAPVPHPFPFHLSLPSKLMNYIETPVYAQAGGGGGSSLPPPPGVSPLINADPVKNAVSAAQDVLIKGWKIDSYSVNAGDNAADVHVRIMKDTSGFKAAMTIDAQVSNFEFASNLKMQQGVGNQIVSGVNGMAGTIQVEWQMGKDTPGVWAAEDKLSLPIAASIPLGEVLGGIPLSIGISAAFLIHPALTGGNEYSAGAFTIGWKGNASNQQGGSGYSGTDGFSFNVNSDVNISPIAPNAFVVTFCAPRFELYLGLLGAYTDSSFLEYGSTNYLKIAASVIDTTLDALESHYLSPAMYAKFKASPLANITASNVLASGADVYIQMLTTEGVTHSSNITLAPCSKIQLVLLGQAGGDLNLLGMTDKAKTTTDFVKPPPWTRWDPDSKFCESI